MVREDWMIREARYKVEIKRLELVIHDTSSIGLEAVALARSGSLVRGEARGKEKQSRLNVPPYQDGNHTPVSPQSRSSQVQQEPGI